MALVEIYHRIEPTFADHLTGNLKLVGRYETKCSDISQTLEDAFRRANSCPDDENEPVIFDPLERSTSIGDVIAVNSVPFQCRRSGWVKIDKFTK